MAETSLTPEDYELEIRQLKRDLKAYLERGEGDRKELRRKAEQVLKLSDEFPRVYADHSDLEGMVADLLAREEQEKFLSTEAPRESPGCLLGWLWGRKRQ